MLLYAITVLVSAFLLFQVQPVIARMILPWFGGSAAVWTICLLFFQCVLLLGYLYAHALFRYLKPRSQTIVHVSLLCLSALLLPVIPAEHWKPTGAEDPTLRILGLLAATVGLPYFLLSTTGPLMQAWYARRYKGSMPYRLYALSNAGSMFALISYPFLFEPMMTTRQQAFWWSIGYGVFILTCSLTATRSGYADPLGLEHDDSPAEPPTAKSYAMWIALPASASVLLLAISTHLSQNVAAIPFLWVLPLSIYLLTFILCFESEGWYSRYWYMGFLAVVLGGMAQALSSDAENITIKIMVPLFACGLFICCMVCHGELAKLKPHPRYLTVFFLCISAGGALGGILVGLVAPHVFKAYYELPFGLLACAILALVVIRTDPDLPGFRTWNQPFSLLATLGVVAFAGCLIWQIREQARGNRVMVRDFYGAMRVRDNDDPKDLENLRTLTHGTINHGEQFTHPERRMQPTTYYGPKSGVGLAISTLQQDGPVRVGVVGLGTGTLAAYGRAGDYFRFYELNPMVLQLARTEFSYITATPAKVETVLGDARLSLERESPQNLDVLAVDAFSSDSIPIHLLTHEAFEIYFHHLKPTGVLAVHVSNRYLNLFPVVRRSADSVHKLARTVETEDEDSKELFGSSWVLVTGDPRFFQRPELRVSTETESNPRVRLWTDHYSNLFRILK
jgi:SAM-dependent methyltransferase